MELSERETLIRVEQQLKDSTANQAQIMNDLKEIFSRIEIDSKLVAQIKSDSKSLNDLMDVKHQEFDRRIAELHKETDENSASISKEKEERRGFQESVKASLSTFKYLFGFLSALAAAISCAVAILQYVKG